MGVSDTPFYDIMCMLGILCCHGEVTYVGLGELAQMITSSCIASACNGHAGPILDMKVQGSRSGKALGIGELHVLASACSASATLDRS